MLKWFYLKVYPILSLFFDTVLLNETSVINLTNDGVNRTYQFVCSAINSKPDVNLLVYDSHLLLPLSSSQNSIVSGSCTSINVCTKILQINFQLLGSKFTNISSLTCSANSTNSLIPLYSTISRNVTVKQIGLFLLFIDKFFSLFIIFLHFKLI